MMTLVVFRIPTGTRAWIEDVAVDVAARRKGVGEALSREALRVALAHGARTVGLSSRPSREAATRPYQRLGLPPPAPTTADRRGPPRGVSPSTPDV